MIYPLYSFEQLDAMEPTTRLKTLRELMRAKDPTFDNYMRRAADKVIEHYGDTQRHLEDVYQDSFEGAFVEASIHDKVRQALFAVDPTNPALDAVPPSYGVWETQRARITALETALAAMTAERDEARKSGCFFCQDCDAVRCRPEITSKLRKIAEQSGKRQWWNVMVYIIELNGLALSYLREAVNTNPIARAAVEGER